MTVGYRLQPPPAPPQAIDRLERQVGSLPAEYREFLARQDGGWVLDNDKALKIIYGVGEDGPEALRIWDPLELYARRVPSWLLPVAEDEYGNLFALSIRHRDRGTVWFWDHEEESSEGEPPVDDNIRQVAPDWRTFLDRLGPPPPIEE
jgi:SMI1 / KNR4 family (SUKH-1)